MKELKNFDRDKLPLVSVIIPVYNCENYLSICIDSVCNQTYKNIEIICIDDGSTDLSFSIIQNKMVVDNRISVTQIENHGQGYARNLGLSISKGKYILFLDADDYLEPLTVQLSVAKVEKEGSDFVVFDWQYYNAVAQESRYVNKDSYFCKKILESNDKFALLDVNGYYTVNKLYRRSFLDEYDIRYGEGYLYEDNPFYVKVIAFADKISLIHSPLYRITVHDQSSTQSNLTTDLHSVGYISALNEIVTFTLNNVNLFSDYGIYLIVKYSLQKFRHYYTERTPKKYKNKFLKEYIQCIKRLSFNDYGKSKFLTAIKKYNIVSNSRYFLFEVLLKVSDVCRPWMIGFLKNLRKCLKKIHETNLKTLKKMRIVKKKELSLMDKYNNYIKQSSYEDVILFAGFDFRYSGNSRYLFEEVLKLKSKNVKVFFITDNPLVPLEYRLAPNSDRANRFIARAKVVVWESWIPLKYKKNLKSIWIQLWHGTPIKKLLFDSSEEQIYKLNQNHKIDKYNDIKRWDYLAVDNRNVSSKFHSAFLYPPEQMIYSGYPRVKYLLSHYNDHDYIENLKKLYSFDFGKKIVLYLPTWRDYNYNTKESEFKLDYVLDLNLLQEKLGTNYEIIYKDHVYLSQAEKIPYKNYADIETQELLLMADYLITDYSSVVFDALAIDLPVLLYCNDYNENEKLRGVYSDIFDSLKPYICENVVELVDRISSYSINEYYLEMKGKWTYSSDIDLAQFVLEKVNK